MKPRTSIALVLLLAAAVFTIYTLITTPAVPDQSNTIVLWTEGRYEISPSLWENSIVKADTSISDPLEIAEGVYFDFELYGDYRYFKITIFISTNSPTFLDVGLSNGEQIFTGYRFEEGITYIIYTDEPWSEGVHYVFIRDISIHSPFVTSGIMNEVHVQIAVANCFTAISEGILPPPLDSILTVESIVTSEEVTFIVRNHSAYDIHQDQNYHLQKKHQ